MQLKKNTRDPRYADSGDKFEAEAPQPEAESFEMPVEHTRTRNRNPEFEGDGPTITNRSGKTESLIDVHSNFDWCYETEQDLRLQGTISGEVICRGLLTVEQDATARAKIQSHDAHIQGRVEGDIICTGRLLLASTSYVSGTLKAGTLVVEEGATLAGHVETASATSGATPNTDRKAVPTPAPAPAPTRTVTSIDEQRHERRSETAAAAAAAPASGRNGRQAPSFAFVPSDDRHTTDRN